MRKLSRGEESTEEEAAAAGGGGLYSHMLLSTITI